MITDYGTQKIEQWRLDELHKVKERLRNALADALELERTADPDIRYPMVAGRLMTAVDIARISLECYLPDDRERS
ncbi:MAG: hypothetical protein ACO242_05360 [Candidatus Fonsibacter ubiquis]